MGTAANPVQDEWLSKKDAAKLLRVKERQVEKRASQGYLQKRFLERLPTEKSARVVYSRADLDALLSGKPNVWGEQVPADTEPREKPVTETRLALMPAPQISAAVAQTDFFVGLASHLARLSAAFPPPAPTTKAWLTFVEAVEYCGLPAAEMDRLLREGLIYSFGRGRGTWRVQRASLDAYGQAAHQ